MTDDASTTEIDLARTAPLGTWRVAVCVEPNGVESYWMISPDPQGAPGCACPACAPHEQVGPYADTVARSTEAAKEGQTP